MNDKNLFFNWKNRYWLCKRIIRNQVDQKNEEKKISKKNEINRWFNETSGDLKMN